MANRKIWICGTVAVALLIAGGLVINNGWTRFNGAINALAVDLAKPDVYISTPALSKLPRDIVKAPVLRDVLTEDFAFYYEEHEDRLGLAGAIKRIAYEHDTTLTDDVIALALDEPAEIAYWADDKGAPRHWLIAMTRGSLSRTLQGLASIAAKDAQLSVIDKVRINGSAVTAYALRLSPRRTLALLSQGNRVVVLSDPGLLFDQARQTDPRSLKIIEQLLSGDAKSQSVFRQFFGLGEPDASHTIVAGARLLSFGYQHFFPALTAMRFDITAGGGSIRTRIRVAAGASLNVDRSIWAAMPANAAACAALPVDWMMLKKLIADAKGAPAIDAEKRKWTQLADLLEGPAAVCWYARSQMHTPVVVAKTKASDAEARAALESLAHWMAPPNAPLINAPARDGVSRWQITVKAPWGAHVDGDVASYQPSLALQKGWITFSPDDALVDLALDAQAQRYPSMADIVASSGTTLAAFAPKQIADLTQREAFAVLSPSVEVLRQAAERRLVPQLNAVRKLPAVTAVATGTPDAQGWLNIEWQPALGSAAAAPLAVSAMGTKP